MDGIKRHSAILGVFLIAATILMLGEVIRCLLVDMRVDAKKTAKKRKLRASLVLDAEQGSVTVVEVQAEEEEEEKTEVEEEAEEEAGSPSTADPTAVQLVAEPPAVKAGSASPQAPVTSSGPWDAAGWLCGEPPQARESSESEDANALTHSAGR